MLLTPERSEEMKAKIQAAVERALLDRDVSARRASLDVVGNDGLIRDIRAGRLPGVDRLAALFEYLGLEFYLGPHRAGAAGFAEAAPRMNDAGSREALRAGFLPIPWHPQAPHPPGLPAAPMAFSRAWLEAAGLAPETLAAVQPETGNTELVALVDIAAPRRGGPAQWCYREAGRARIGLLQFEADLTLVLPETAGARVRVLATEDRGRLALLGRVVWLGRREPGTETAAPG